MSDRIQRTTTTTTTTNKDTTVYHLQSNCQVTLQKKQGGNSQRTPTVERLLHDKRKLLRACSTAEQPDTSYFVCCTKVYLQCIYSVSVVKVKWQHTASSFPRRFLLRHYCSCSFLRWPGVTSRASTSQFPSRDEIISCRSQVDPSRVDLRTLLLSPLIVPSCSSSQWNCQQFFRHVSAYWLTRYHSVTKDQAYFLSLHFPSVYY